MGRRARNRQRRAWRPSVRSRRRMMIPRWRYVVAYSVLLGLRVMVGGAVFLGLWWITRR